MKKKAVLILGMHRSGTSAFGGVLEKVGRVGRAYEVEK